MNSYRVTFTVNSKLSTLTKVTISCEGEAHDANMLANAVYYSIRKKYPGASILRGATIAGVTNDS
jgi:hypothetical protein